MSVSKITGTAAMETDIKQKRGTSDHIFTADKLLLLNYADHAFQYSGETAVYSVLKKGPEDKLLTSCEHPHRM